ncbi:alkylhydroperoxidase AhpD family core domain-containing protein [Rhizobiales bacterium GAS191]|nr:alkylhydroperoxidase AhpD family core domain-containing protein [Rhizobiales bacterium GAS191]
MIRPEIQSPRPLTGKALFDDLTEDTAPAAAQPVLAKAREVFGFVPNLAITMAAVPAALEGYFHVLQAFGETPLSPIEQQIVLMSVSRANQAEYSLAIHAALAAKLGANADTVRGAATGGAIGDPKLAALRRFSEALTVSRGQVSASEVESFLAAGYDRAALVAVAFGVAVKTFANTLAHLAKTPVDAAFAPALASLRQGTESRVQALGG